MAHINIYLTKKLESLVPKNLISEKQSDKDCDLNSWNATYFNLKRQKHLLITNSKTKFSVIIGNISTKDFQKITEIFIEKLIIQVEYENIDTNGIDISALYTQVYLHKTNNDKSTIGVQNNLMSFILDWKDETSKDETWDFRMKCKQLNKIPFLKLKYGNPHEEIKNEFKQ